MRFWFAILVSGLMTLAPAPGSTSGGPPVPLFDMVRYSDMIIIAEVTELQIVGKLQDRPVNNAKAVLTIQKVLKGQAFEATVDVFFVKPGRNIISTAGHARYNTGEKVLAFLYFSPNGHGYRTFDQENGALAIKTEKPFAGAKVLTPGELEKAEVRIEQIQEILEIKDDEERKRRTVNWLVECAIDPTTRWIDGLYELQGRFGKCLGHERDCDFMDYPSMLTEQHREMLFAALEDYETIGVFALTLADLVKDSHRDQLAAFMLDRLDSEQDFSNALPIAEFIAEMKDDSFLAELARAMREYRNKHRRNKDPEYEQSIIDRFVDSARLPE